MLTKRTLFFQQTLFSLIGFFFGIQSSLAAEDSFLFETLPSPKNTAPLRADMLPRQKRKREDSMLSSDRSSSNGSAAQKPRHVEKIDGLEWNSFLSLEVPVSPPAGTQEKFRGQGATGDGDGMDSPRLLNEFYEEERLQMAASQLQREISSSQAAGEADKTAEPSLSQVASDYPSWINSAQEFSSLERWAVDTLVVPLQFSNPATAAPPPSPRIDADLAVPFYLPPPALAILPLLSRAEALAVPPFQLSPTPVPAGALLSPDAVLTLSERDVFLSDEDLFNLMETLKENSGKG